MAWEVNFFKTARGEDPVGGFILKQQESTIAKALQAIDLLEEYGPFLKPPYAKKLESGLYELRTRGKGAIRILYTPHKGAFYLLHAFKKKTQKTPLKELKTALDRKRKLV